MKRFLLAGVLSFIGVAPSLVTAQVTSINAVGYVNVTTPAGFSIICNPVAATSNKARDLFASAPVGTVLYKYTGTGFDIMTKLADNFWRDNPATGGAFFNDPTKEFDLAPGEGLFINNASGSPVTITFVGEVPAGNLSNPVPAGFSIRSSQVPQSGLLQTLLEFPMATSDAIYTYSNTDGGYTIYTLLDSASGFWRKTPPIGSPTFGADKQPTIEVGQAFWSFKNSSANWTRTFSIN